MQERRRYVRLNIPLEISYLTKGKGGTPLKAVTKNISPNGAMFTLEKKLPQGAIIDIEIKIPTQAESIPIKAKIAWSKKENSHYEAGFEFVQIPEESKKIFFQYLCNFMYDQLKKV